MKKICKTKEFCRLSTHEILCVSILLFMLAFPVFSSMVYGQQQTKFSLKLENVSLLDALKEINKLSANSVVFKKEEVEAEDTRVTVDLKNVTTLQAVEACLKNTSLRCQLYDNKVIVIPDKKKLITITGIVIDEQGEFLPGATIVVKGKTMGTSSGKDGKFLLLIPQETKVLVVSFVGYKTKEIVLDGKDFISVKLEEEVLGVDEVVVTGIFTRKAESYTGSIVVVNNKDLKRVGNQNLFQSLKNLDPSLLIMDNLTMGSNPNSLPDMKLRGTSTLPGGGTGTELKGNYQNKPNQPLFILDGFETTVERVFDLDMNRIETVAILKDASAKAIYGAKAANGVVVIETKQIAGEGQLVTYVGSIDLTMPDLTSYDLCNSLEKLEVERAENVYSSTFMYTDVKLEQLYNERKKRALEGLNTYWLSKPLRTGIGNKHTLSIEMGTKELRVIADFSYNNVAGVMKGSRRTNILGSVDVAYRYHNFQFKNNMSVVSNKGKNSPYGVFSEYAVMNPYWLATDENGIVNRYAEVSETSKIPNPLYNATLNTKNETTYLEFVNNFYVEYSFWDDFKVRARMGISTKRSDSDEYYPANHTRFEGYYGVNVYRKGSYQVNNGKSNNLSGDLNLQYAKYKGNHHFFMNLVMDLSENKWMELVHVAEGFPSDKMNNMVFARDYALDSRPTGASSIGRTLGFTASGAYDYKNTYLFDATYRTSASSMFGKDNRWATFWSTGIGWNLHQESFLSGWSALQQLKLRGSVGSTGNPNFQSNQSVALYSYYQGMDYQGMSGAYLQNMENATLKWEQKFDYNLGCDLKLWGLVLKVDYYIAITQNMVADVSTPASTGFIQTKDNLGKVKNQGVEIAGGYTVIRNKHGFLNLNLSVATNENKILKISDRMKAFNEQQDKLASRKDQTTPIHKYYDGMPLNAIWAVSSLGIDPANGKEIYLDIDGNKTYEWSSSNLVMVGSSDPKYNGNFGLNGEYKGFGLSVVFRFLGGGKMYNQTLVDRVENIDPKYNVDRRVLTGRWKTPGQNAQFIKLGDWVDPDTGYSIRAKTQATTRFVQDREELDISSLSLYYEFNRSLLARIGLQRLRVGAYMNDVVKFSSIKIERGTSYPFARTASFSLTATF